MPTAAVTIRGCKKSSEFVLDGIAPQNIDLPPRSTGTTMSPAPCALAISHDQVVRSQKLTHIPTQVGCRARQRFQIAMTNSVVAPPIWSHWDGITAPTMSDE